MKLDDNNRPYLPKISDQSLEDKKRIIREYMTLLYSKSLSKIEQHNTELMHYRTLHIKSKSCGALEGCKFR